MSIAHHRAVGLPVLLTAVVVVSYLAPIPPALFSLHLERLSSVGAPAFIVFLELDPIVRAASLPRQIDFALGCALLVLVTLCWFTFILLPFWSDFRLRGLSLWHTRFLFALFGVVITAVAWIGLGGWRVHDA